MLHRVQLKPYLDRWMMGDRYGTIVSEFRRAGRRFYRVRLDVSSKTITVSIDDVEFA